MDAAAIEKLEKLGALLEKGLLTKEEFERQKAALLGSPLPVSTPSVTEIRVEAAPVSPADSGPSAAAAQTPPPTGTGLRRAASFLVTGMIGVLILVLGVGALAATYMISAERDRALAELEATRYAADQARLEQQTTQQMQAIQQAAAEQEKADKEKAEKEAKAKQEAEWERQENDIIANDVSEADLPMISGALSKCDDRCSTLLDECTYVECKVTNYGGGPGTAAVTLVADGRTETKSVTLAAGKSKKVKVEFHGFDAATCDCAVY